MGSGASTTAGRPGGRPPPPPLKRRISGEGSDTADSAEPHETTESDAGDLSGQALASRRQERSERSSFDDADPVGLSSGAGSSMKFRVGMKVICQDQFPSKYTGETMFKWRPAEIVDLETSRRGSTKTARVKIHFDKWSERHDIWLNLHTEWDRLGLLNDLSEQEGKTSDSARLSPGQRATIREIVTRTVGTAPEEKPEPVGIRGEDGCERSSPVSRNLRQDRSHEGGDSGRSRRNRGKGGTNSDSDNDMIGLTPDPETDDALEHKTRQATGDEARRRKLIRKASFDPGYQPTVGDQVDVLDQYNNKNKKREEKWRAAKICEVRGNMLKVHFVGWEDQWDIFVNFPCARIAPPGSMVQARMDDKKRHSGNGGDSGEEIDEDEDEKTNRRNRQARGSRGSRESDGSYDGSNRRGKRRSRSEIGYGRNDSDSDGSDAEPTRGARGNVDGYRRSIGDTDVDESDRDVDGTDTDDIASGSSGATKVKSYRSGGRRSRARRRSEARMAAASARNAKRGGSGSGGSGGGGSEREFLRGLTRKGMQVVEMEADGNCLFRAVCHQIYNDPERHAELRRQVAAHMESNRERFSIFCTHDFSLYLERIRRNGVWGDDLEIRAMEELIDRSIEIYVAESKEDGTIEPLKTNFDEELTGADVTPIKLSYHGSSHYNSVVDEKHALPIAPRDSSVIYDVRDKRHKDEPPPTTQPNPRRSSFGITLRGGGWRRKKW